MTAPSIRREDLISRKAAAATLGVPGYTFDREARRLGLKKYRVLNDTQVFYLRSDIASIEFIQEVPSDG